jgi:hypothetical protein
LKDYGKYPSLPICLDSQGPGMKIQLPMWRDLKKF